MSFPYYLMSCCIGCNNTREGYGNNSLIEMYKPCVNISCMVSSSISLLGVFYLVLPRNQQNLNSSWCQMRILNGPSLRSTIISLIASDVLAVAGVLLRSVLWMTGNYPFVEDHVCSDAVHIFCIICNVWIQYFYLCSFFWNLIFGLELVMSLHYERRPIWPKYLIGWIIPAIVCSAGSLVTYLPSLDGCLEKGKTERIILCMTVFIPIVLVTVVNPILFCISAKLIRRQLISHSGCFTRVEREILKAACMKFFFITLIFVICWLPNIITGVVSLSVFSDSTFGDSKSVDLTYMWIIMAIANPIEALFNCLVFRGWPGWRVSCSQRLSSNDQYKRLSGLLISGSSRIPRYT